MHEVTASPESTRYTLLPHALPAELKPNAVGLLHGCQAITILHQTSDSLLAFADAVLHFMGSSGDEDALAPAVAVWRVVPLAISGDLEWSGMPIAFDDKCVTLPTVLINYNIIGADGIMITVIQNDTDVNRTWKTAVKTYREFC